MTTIYLAEITAATDAAGTTTVLRYSSGTGYSDPSAAGWYEPRIVQPANLVRSMWSSGTTSGAVEVGYGELVLANIDGGLDALAGYGFDGRSFRLLVGDDRAAYNTFTLVLAGTMEQAVFTIGDVTVRVRDKLALLDQRRASPNLYGGTNSLPAGVDGTADDLRGRPKPKTWGRVLNVSPPNVNTSRLIYQVNDGAVQDVPAVYDNGVSLTKGSDYSSQVDMETNAPSASNYRVWPAGGMFRLGSSPAGQVTADVTQGTTTAARTAAQILNAIATGPGGLTGGEVSATDIAVLDTAQSAETGVWVDGDHSAREVMETVAGGVGAWFGFDHAGVLRMGRLAAPSGTPALTLRRFTMAAPADNASADIVDVERIASDDAGRGIPVWRVTVGHSRNWTVQTGGIAGSVTAARRAFVAEQFRTAVASDATVPTKHLLSPTIDRETLLLTQAAADTEAARLLALYSVRRDRLKVRTRLDGALVAAVDLGSVVSLTLNRFGYGSGKLFTVTAIEYDAANNLAELELWG